MDTSRWETFKNKRSRRDEGSAFPGSKKADLPLKIRAPCERSKKVKKIIDDWMAIFSLTQTSADASRYEMYGKGGWPHEPPERVVSMERSNWPSHKNLGD
jgi:hypothetical protein